MAQKRVGEKKALGLQAQQDKVGESDPQEYRKRLEQRQQALVDVEHEFTDPQHHHAKLTDQDSTLGPPGERVDRDFRKQTLMTIRMLFLENASRAFMAVLLGHRIRKWVWSRA